METHNGINLGVVWAKLPRKKDAPLAFHPLAAHLLDVAAVAERIWDQSLSYYARRRLAGWLGIDSLDVARVWVAALAGLHDTGKGCPAFQQQAAAERLRGLYGGALFALDGAGTSPLATPHGIVTAATLGELLHRHFDVEGDVARRVARVVGGHHGFFPAAKECNDAGRPRGGHFPARVGNDAWEQIRSESVRIIGEAIGLAGSPGPTRLDDPAIMALAEITCVADWIGSNTRFFPFLAEPPPPMPPPFDLPRALAYLDNARKGAEGALKRLHWGGWEPPPSPASFPRLFPNIKQPCDLQEQLERLANDLASDLPALVIVEAPMGEGKTEAALYAVDRWSVPPGPRGAYVAMPTQATSNQMFSRVRQFLARRFPGDRVTLQLLHGHSALSAELRAMLRDDSEDESARENPDDFVPAQTCDDDPRSDGHDREQAEVIAGEWFTARKRGLLAPFGVGTVDQALLAVLPTKHQFVRLGALAGKVVVFDEVHAYDAYMSIIHECLLEWLAALGTPVVLLSATLPRSRRDALLRAYARGLTVERGELFACEPYPRISWVTAAGSGSRSVSASERITRTLRLCWVDGDLPDVGGEFALGMALLKQLEHGGCAAIVCNTVRRARDVYKALQAYFPAEDAGDGRPELELFHARFRFLERDQREKAALLRFGAPGAEVEMQDGSRQPVRRPHRAVLVATQVIEQSLDLDFDVMVSDMAPADLLLQRSGREWRHERSWRPNGLTSPELWICTSEMRANGVPVFDRSKRAVYNAHVLLRSWLALQGREKLAVPGDVETLIEQVYAVCTPPEDVSDALKREWMETNETFDHDTLEAEAIAKRSRIWPPFHPGSDLLDATLAHLKEDAPDLHEVFRARTRLGDESSPFVILWPDEWQEYQRLPKAPRPTIEQLCFLLERSVGLTAWQVRRSPDAFGPIPGASRSATLRGVKLALLDAQGIARPKGREYQIRFDKHGGVDVEDTK